MANEKILVIDDDPDLVEVIRLTLEAKGYQVFSAASGTEGLEKTKEIHPDGLHHRGVPGLLAVAEP